MISESFSYYVKSPEKQTLAGDRNYSGIGSIMRNDTNWNWKKKILNIIYQDLNYSNGYIVLMLWMEYQWIYMLLLYY